MKNNIKPILRNLRLLTCLTFVSVYAYAQKSTTNAKIENRMVKAMEWQEQHPIFETEPTDWTNGAYYTGVVRAHMATKNPIFFAALTNMAYNNKWQPGPRVFHADDLIISYSYLYLAETFRKDKVDIGPTANFIQKHVFEPNIWRDGLAGDAVKKTLWWWCDALFMAPPVLVYYAKQTKDPKYLDAMNLYYSRTYDLLYDKDEHLFARDLRFKWTGDSADKREENGEKIFWSRGNGWVLGGLALVLENMPKDDKHRSFYENLFVEMAAKVKSLQQKDGLWRTSLLSPKSYNHGEVSGSGFFTFALAWGINNNLLDRKDYSASVLKAWKALEKCQQKNGMVGWVQNIGASPKPASEDSWQNFGTGAFLMAGSEVLKLNR